MGREEAKAPELSHAMLDRLVCGICSGPSIWHAGELHDALQRLLESEASQIDEGLQSGASQEDAGVFTLAKLLVDVPRGIRKVLLRMDRMQGMEGCLETYGRTMVDLLASRSLEPRSAWQQTVKFAKMLADEECTSRARTSSTTICPGIPPCSSSAQAAWTGSAPLPCGARERSASSPRVCPSCARLRHLPVRDSARQSPEAGDPARLSGLFQGCFRGEGGSERQRRSRRDRCGPRRQTRAGVPRTAEGSPLLLPGGFISQG